MEEASATADAGSTGSIPAEDLETIAVVDDDRPDKPGKGETQIRALGSETQVGGGVFDESGLTRPPDPKALTATRSRTFHAKLNEGAVAYMNRQINEWSDGDADVTIKFATSTIGVFEGKKADPHLIVTVFY